MSTTRDGGTKERRTYDQQCALAYALDVVGERWTLLIIRELLIRPRRYGELLEALPGIGTNLLADRLSSLASADIVAPIDPQRRTAGYALTELGERLRDPVLDLARFGLAYAATRPTTASGPPRPSWAVLAIEAMVDEARAAEVDETYEFDVAGEVFHISVVRGSTRTASGPAEDPVLRVATDARTFFDLGLGRIDPLEAVLSEAVRVDGPPAAVLRCLRLLGLVGGRPGTDGRQRPPGAGSETSPAPGRRRPDNG
jgi:DNA-binding HxlR family transcriptional regulator